MLKNGKAGPRPTDRGGPRDGPSAVPGNAPSGICTGVGHTTPFMLPPDARVVPRVESVVMRVESAEIVQSMCS
jgi:hypothetical protein